MHWQRASMYGTRLRKKNNCTFTSISYIQADAKPHDEVARKETKANKEPINSLRPHVHQRSTNNNTATTSTGPTRLLIHTIDECVYSNIKSDGRNGDGDDNSLIKSNIPWHRFLITPKPSQWKTELRQLWRGVDPGRSPQMNHLHTV